MSGYSDFSPYQPSPDEDRTARLQKEKHKQKQKNVKGKGKQSAPQNQSQYSSYQAGDDLPPEAYQQSSLLEEGLFSDAPSIGAAKGSQGGVRVNKYQTKVPIRVDIEAALTYVLGPITGVAFLILETQNDYVRFHAWQSSLVFASMMALHFIIMFISSILSWMLFACDILLIAWLSYRAYLDGASLERYEVPYFGALAAEWVDTE
ncbi:hypothetical protein INT43_000556 [Umbelopsis isabellina]|uniref:Uncharacterized protein n=1 Tax=Mortierella isabellina TaxID=91625 RepID=A0A8H7ULY6_MORIS|nr:hypothetical protein INT43_000556 [Umbelopsis isabellina]